jgi:hypothetical protein
MKVIVFEKNQPCIDIVFDNVQNYKFGLSRDRHPDFGRSEFSYTRMDPKYYQEVELSDYLKKILIEDICKYYDDKQAYEKLVEFNLIK